MAAPPELTGTGPVARTYSRVVVALRHVIILGWVLLAMAASQLPASERPDTGGLEGFVPDGSPAVQAEAESLREFGFPLVSRTVLVQRDADGLSPYDQARAVIRALALTQGDFPGAQPLVGGLPVTNTLGLFPSSRERGTTVLTYLFARPGAGFGSQTRAADRFANRHLESDEAYVGVTGSIPARVAQARILRDRLPVMETATLIAVISIVALYFRSLTAPLVALATAGLAFYMSLQLADVGGRLLDITVPSELEPLILALVLGIVTDYVIFFLAGMRRNLAAGLGRLPSARSAAATTGPIVAVAGLTVAAGTGVLVVAESVFFSAFGPAMALAVGVASVVSLTLVPALLAVFGKLLFWPSRLRGGDSSRLTRAAARQMTRKGVAVLLVVVSVAGLGLLGAALSDLRLGVSFVPSLPREAAARAAGAAAADGFAPGILSPTMLLVQGEGVGSDRQGLARLGDRLAREPGVAGVIGPGDLLPGLERRVLTAASGDAVRYLVVFEDEPLGASAIASLNELVEVTPGLGQAAGLSGVEYSFGGDTAVAGELVQVTREDLGRIALAALITNFVLLVVFLRAIVAPLFLLASSVLALVGALGAMTLVFQGVFGHDGITFYVPFASAVLLLSLGSDYNIFGVGYIWERARQVPLRTAIEQSVPETSAAITAAGVTLAASFGMLALVPLQPFRELAFVMAVGILIDALLVRSVLVPAMLTLLGRAAGWPRRMARSDVPRTEPVGGSRER